MISVRKLVTGYYGVLIEPSIALPGLRMKDYAVVNPSRYSPFIPVFFTFIKTNTMENMIIELPGPLSPVERQQFGFAKIEDVTLEEIGLIDPLFTPTGRRENDLLRRQIDQFVEDSDLFNKLLRYTDLLPIITNRIMSQAYSLYSLYLFDALIMYALSDTDLDPAMQDKLNQYSTGRLGSQSIVFSKTELISIIQSGYRGLVNYFRGESDAALLFMDEFDADDVTDSQAKDFLANFQERLKVGVTLLYQSAGIADNQITLEA